MKQKSNRGGAGRGQGRKSITGQCSECLKNGICADVHLWKGLCKKHYNRQYQQIRRYKKTGRLAPEEVRNKVQQGESIVEQVWKYFVLKLPRRWKYDSTDSENQYWPSIEEIITRSKGDITLSVFKEYIDWLFSKDCYITKGSDVKPGHLYSSTMWGAFLEKKDKKVQSVKKEAKEQKEQERQVEEETAFIEKVKADGIKSVTKEEVLDRLRSVNIDEVTIDAVDKLLTELRRETFTMTEVNGQFLKKLDGRTVSLIDVIERLEEAGGDYDWPENELTTLIAHLTESRVWYFTEAEVKKFAKSIGLKIFTINEIDELIKKSGV